MDGTLPKRSVIFQYHGESDLYVSGTYDILGLLEGFSGANAPGEAGQQ